MPDPQAGLRARLSDEQHHVTQQCGAEPPFTGKYWDHKRSPAPTTEDAGYGRVRTEVLRAERRARLGHAFHGGPPPTGMRYCVNSASLAFMPLGG